MTPEHKALVARLREFDRLCDVRSEEIVLMAEAADAIEALAAALATFSKETIATENRIIDAEFAAQEAKCRADAAEAKLAAVQTVRAQDEALAKPGEKQ